MMNSLRWLKKNKCNFNMSEFFHTQSVYYSLSLHVHFYIYFHPCAEMLASTHQTKVEAT